jgi:hypothetical protein
METRNSDEWQEVFEARKRLGMDDEVFYTVLYDYLSCADGTSTGLIVRYLESFMERFDGDTANWCRVIQANALEQLEQEIAALGLPPGRTANELARREFSIEHVSWLRCWQASRLLYLLRQEGIFAITGYS